MGVPTIQRTDFSPDPQQWVLPESQMKVFLDALRVLVNPGHIHLYVNDITPDKASVLGDFTEMVVGDVPGYGAAAMDRSVVVRGDDGKWMLQFVAAPIVCTGPTSGDNVAYGWFMTDAADAVLLGAGRFPAPVAFMVAGDASTVEGTLSMGANA